MKLQSFLQVGATVVFLAACGDTDSIGRNNDRISGTSGGSSGASGAAGTSGGGSSGSGGASSGIPDEVTLELDPFEVEGGSELSLCQTFKNPFGGNEVFLNEFEVHMAEGSHHLTVNYADFAADSGVTPCSGLESPEGPFTVQRPDEVFTYQEGVAAQLRKEQGLRLILHFINVTNNGVTPSVRLTLRRTPSENVQQIAFIRALSTLDVEVAPRSIRTIEGGITLSSGSEWDLLWVLPHMHRAGTHFTVSAGPAAAPNLIYETHSWDTMSHKLDPALQLHPGDALNYSCTYENTGATPLILGPSPNTEAMCQLVFHYAARRQAP